VEIFYGRETTFYQTDNSDEVLKKYREYLAATPSLVEDAKKELRGKNLACWCKPSEDCHADILLEIANKGHNARR